MLRRKPTRIELKPEDVSEYVNFKAQQQREALVAQGQGQGQGPSAMKTEEKGESSAARVHGKSASERIGYTKKK